MELKLPHRWSDLSLGELQVMMTSENPLERVSACSGKSVAQLRKMPQKLLEAAGEHIDNLLTQETARFEKVLEMDGKRLGFIPDWDAFTAGEWIDLEGYMDDFWKNAHKVMAILYREVTYELGESYEIKKYTAKEDASTFEEMPADLVSGTLLFFWTTRNELLHSIQSSLLRVAEEATRLAKNGDGITSSTPSQEKTSSRWTRLRRYLSKLFSNTSHI
tara:strand:- start:1297 stop:1950 length:654 start_codon:yes stop_codon:yes gene_type:complete